jgi:hypothetical protein
MRGSLLGIRLRLKKLYIETNKNLLFGSLCLITFDCLGQDDYYSDDLQALVKPINISFLKSKGYKEVEISYYRIGVSDTVFTGRKKIYTLANDSVMSEQVFSVHSSTNKAVNQFKEDRFGYLYPVSMSDGKEFQSKYVVDQNGLPQIRKSIYGKQYFYYDNNGRVTKSSSDTFYIATNSPCNQNQFIYDKEKLIKRINSVYDAGTPEPISSDTISFKYDRRNKLTGYSPTVNSTLSSRGDVRIVYGDDDRVIELIRCSKSEMVLYKFD